MRARSVMIVWLVLVAFGAHPAVAESDLNPKAAFVAELQKAVGADYKDWIATHMHFPVRYFGKSAQTVGNKTWLLEHYASIFGPELKASVAAQDPEGFFENWQGIMIGEGSRNIWLRNFGADTELKYEIITINNSD